MICQAVLRGAPPTSIHALLCRRCSGRIPWIAPSDIRCQTCGRYDACPDCPRRADTHFVCNRSAVRYTEDMKRWLSRLKYRGDERLQTLFATMMSGAFEHLLRERKLRPRQIACLTCVPLSEERLQERGFNQTELIAGSLASRYRIPLYPLLRRTRHTGKQSYKSRAERLQDLRHAFERIQSPFSNRPAASPIILIDDVYTTGSTLNECARALRGAGKIDIYGLTWAR